MNTLPQSIVTEDIFNTDVNTLFDLWTNEYYMLDWAYANGHTMASFKVDLQQGGRWRSCMLDDKKNEYWAGGVFEEIVQNEKLIFTHAIIDDMGQTSSNVRLCITFSKDEHGTRQVLEIAPIDDGVDANAHVEYWKGCLENLKKLLL